MSNNTVTQGPLVLDLSSVCGCRFGVRAGGLGTAVLLASDGTEVKRLVSTDHLTGFALLDWLTVVTEAFEQTLAGHGDAAGSFWSSPDGTPLSADATLLDGPGDVVRLVVTMEPGKHDSLDYCHVAVTLDIALADLARQVSDGAATITATDDDLG